MAIKPFLEIGKVVATHGLCGEIRVQPWCDHPSVLLSLKELFFDDRGERSQIIEKARVKNNIVILKFQSINTIEQAQQLIHQVLYVRREQIPLSDGAYFVQDLLGMRVFDAKHPSVCYGKIVEVISTGANDVYRLLDDQGVERLVPVIDDVVADVCLEKEQVLICPLRGLFDDAD